MSRAAEGGVGARAGCSWVVRVTEAELLRLTLRPGPGASSPAPLPLALAGRGHSAWVGKDTVQGVCLPGGHF